MEFGGVPEKIDGYFQWGPIFYVCSSAIGSLPCIRAYTNIYHILIYVVPFGE